MLKLKKVMCGKPECKKCPHGFYVYAQWKEGGKTKEKYMGKYGEQKTNEKIKEFSKKYPRVLNENLETIYQNLKERN